MSVIRLARAFTWAVDKIVKFDGCYHVATPTPSCESRSGALSTANRGIARCFALAFADLPIFAAVQQAELLRKAFQDNKNEIAG